MIISSITPITWNSQGNLFTDYAGRVFVRPDGRELLKTTYPDLYSLLGDRFNLGSTTVGYFRIPNFVGAFIRGNNLGGSTDIDAPLRTLPGSPTIDSGPGTVQVKALTSHTHSNPSNLSAKWVPGEATAFVQPNSPNFSLSNNSASGVLSTPAASGLGIVETSSDCRPMTVIVDYLMRVA